MPLGGLTDEYLKLYEERGILHSSITIPVVAVQQRSEKDGAPPELSGAEKSVYDHVLADLEHISLLLGSIVGTSVEQCPVDVAVNGDAGYVLTRKVLHDHNILEITKSTWPNFYWRVAIQDSGDPEHQIRGFYHGCSSGNLGDIKAAFDNTKLLFPRVGSKLKTGAIHAFKPSIRA